MATPKRPRAKAPAATEDRSPTLVVKGLTADEVRALDAITEKRSATIAALGGTTSRNAVVVALLRDAIRRESGEGAP